jgi:hypothetical protein
MRGETAVPKDFPRCGACVHWSGHKEVRGDLVFYDVFDYGRCNNFSSPAYGNEVQADHSCSHKEDFR